MAATKTRKRPPGSVVVQQSAIQQAGDLLQKLPEKPKENWSLREAIESLEGSIVQALDRGYSHDEVAELLDEKGISISVSSLKRYLAASRRDKGTQTRRTRKLRGQAAAKAKTEEATSVEPVAAETPSPSKAEAAEPATPGRRKRSASTAPKASAPAAKAKPRSASTRSKASTGKAAPTNGRRKKKEA